MSDFPEEFSWTRAEDVRTRLGVADARGFVTPPGSNQRTCDACWAVSLSQVVSDRFRIALRDATFAQLSPMQLLEESEQFCKGGSFEQGIDMLQRDGVASLCCHPYNTSQLRAGVASTASCTQTPQGARANFASLYGSTAQFQRLDLPWTCGAQPTKRFRTRRGSSSELSTRSIAQSDIDGARVRIQKAIFMHGPIVCRIAVLRDMFDAMRSSRGLGEKEPFAATAGVFMSITGERSLYYGDVAATGNSCCVGSGCNEAFGHGLAVVGWGVAEFADVPQRGADAVRLASVRGAEADALEREVDRAYRARRRSSGGGLVRLREQDMAPILRRAGLAPRAAELSSALVLRQRVPYWVLRNTWGVFPGAEDRDYASGLIKVACCDTYRVCGRPRRVNLTFGVEHRYHCGHVTASMFGSRVTVCGGAIDPGVPVL